MAARTSRVNPTITATRTTHTHTHTQYIQAAISTHWGHAIPLINKESQSRAGGSL